MLRGAGKVRPPLGSACNLVSFPEEVELFRPREALPGRLLGRTRREFRDRTQSGEASLEPLMKPPITHLGAQRVPGMGAGKSEAVGPVRIVRHESTTRRPPEQGP